MLSKTSTAAKRMMKCMLSGVGISVAIAWVLSVLGTEFPNVLDRISNIDLDFGYFEYTGEGTSSCSFAVYTDGKSQFIGHWIAYPQGVHLLYAFADLSFDRPDLLPKGVAIAKREPASCLPIWIPYRNSSGMIFDDNHISFFTAAGWPWIAFKGECAFPIYAHSLGTQPALSSSAWKMAKSTTWALPLKRSALQAPGVLGRWITMLPIRPIFPGFLYNTAFWGGLIFAALCLRDGALTLRSRRRRARGLCWKCKHELAGVSPCPECGTDIDSEQRSLSQ